MQISFEEEQQVFHLYNDKISYVIQVEKQRYLKHCYYGKRIKRWHSGIKDYDSVRIRLRKTEHFLWIHS